MTKKTSNLVDIGRYVRVPNHVRRAGVRPRALQVWQEIAINSSPEKPLAWVRQPTVAAELKCSVDTIGRSIQELLKAGLLVETGGYHQGRYKIYVVMWTAETLNHLSQVREPAPVKVEAARPAPVREVHRQEPEPQHLNRVLLEQKKSTFTCSPEPKRESTESQSSETELLSIHGAEWEKQFECLDGLSGRPSLRDCVEAALNHTARHKCYNLKIYLDNWLRNAAQRWKQDWAKEKALHWSDTSLAEGVRIRKRTEEEQSRKSYEERVKEFNDAAIRNKPPMTEEQIQRGNAFIAAMRRDDELKAKRQADTKMAA
jgi:hypothetical protein